MIADLCLVLLLDASGSIDAAEYDMQMKATAEALASPEIVERITSGPHHKIAVTVMEWSLSTTVIVPWTVVVTPLDAARVASTMLAHTRDQQFSTSIGGALEDASKALLAVPVDCVRRVVDISGDGANNAGRSPAEGMAMLEAQGAMVNAIVIEDEPGVLDYYRGIVSGFVIAATWDSYKQAIKAKLQLEIAAR